MKWVKALALVMVLVGFTTLNAQEPCTFWFSLDPNDPTPVTCLDSLEESDTFALYAWLIVYDTTWYWIDAFTYPIWFDTTYLEILDAGINDALLAPYMFKGVNWPGSPNPPGPDWPEQLMWFAAICFGPTGCMMPTNPYYIGYAVFHVKVTPPDSCTMVIDTMTYYPSNPPLINDNTGTMLCYPEWTPFEIAGHPTGVAEKDAPAKFFLGEFKPNPFNGSTSISFGLPKKSFVNVVVYDVSGRLVRTLVSGVKEAGTYTIEWNGRDDFGRSLSSGAYFVRMVTDEFKTTKRLLLLR